MQEETFIDDETVPVETRICYSEGNGIWEMIQLIFFLCAGIFLLWASNLLYSNGKIFNFLTCFGMCLMCLFSVYSSYKNYKEVLKKSTQIIVNEKGLETMNTKFFTWDSIKDEKIIAIGISFYLVYKYEDGNEVKFHFNNEISHQDLHHLLKIYRGRFEQQRNKENLQRS